MGKIMFENFNEYLNSIKQLQELSDIPVVNTVEFKEEDCDSDSDSDTEEYNNITGVVNDTETVLSDVSGSKNSIMNVIPTSFSLSQKELIKNKSEPYIDSNEFNTDGYISYTNSKTFGSPYEDEDENCTKK
jgi:hypothetical protein